MKLNAVQFLRAVAVLLVVYRHSIDLQVQYGSSFQDRFYFLHHFGSVGVDVFFVISGFIISYVAGYLNGTRAAIKFIAKRFIRINPLYYIFSAVMLALNLASSNFSFSVYPVLKTLVIIPVETGNTFQWPVLHVGWTLSFEWFFYLVFSILIFTNVASKEFTLLGIMILLVLAGTVFNFQAATLKFLTNPVILEFACGAIIGWLYKKVKVPSWIAAVLLAAAGSWLVRLVFSGYGDISEAEAVIDGNAGLQRFYLWGIASVLIVFGCIFLEQNTYFKKLWNNELSLMLGNASFAVYLVHPVVFFCLSAVFHKSNYYGNADVMVWLQVLIAVVCGIAVHLYMEKPLVKSTFRLFSYLQLRTHKIHTWIT